MSTKPTSTTYHITGGGQGIRQNQDANNNTVKIEKRTTTYVHDAGCSGGDSYTQEIWGSSLDFVKSCAKKWAYHPSSLNFEVVEA